MAKLPLFGNLEDDEPWRDEWQNMPEFVQEDLQAYQQIIVNFENKKDVEDFARLVGCNLTEDTNSIWFPYKKKLNKLIKRYVDES